MRKLCLAGFILAIIILVHARNSRAADPESETDVTERVIEIKGTLEKPRIIFILPKARLRKEARVEGESLTRSFIPDILKPVYPEFLTKEEGFMTLQGGKK